MNTEHYPSTIKNLSTTEVREKWKKLGWGQPPVDLARMAVECGLTDKDLAPWVTDFGDAEHAIKAFAAMVAEHCAQLADDPASALAVLKGRSHPSNAVGSAIRALYCMSDSDITQTLPGNQKSGSVS